MKSQKGHMKTKHSLIDFFKINLICTLFKVLKCINAIFYLLNIKDIDIK